MFVEYFWQHSAIVYGGELLILLAISAAILLLATVGDGLDCYRQKVQTAIYWEPAAALAGIDKINEVRLIIECIRGKIRAQSYKS
mgnify:CR=1 FL=1